MEICETCACKCKIITEDCIKRYSELENPKVLKLNHYQYATDDIDDLLSVDCAEALCAAITQAVTDLQAYNDTKQDGDPDKAISDFLSSIWLDILNNRHFLKWYANRLFWHWLDGASISDIKSVGLVVKSNTDNDYKNDFQHAEESERQRLQNSADRLADEARKKFLKHYWNKNKNTYSCYKNDCCGDCTQCTRDYCECKKIGDCGSNDSISMIVS